jgi:hypothetical protein
LNQGSKRSRSKIFATPVITITPGNKTVDLGENVAYTARVTNKAGALLSNSPPIRWRSTAGAVATVDQNGFATTLKKGTTAITAVIVTGVAHEYTPAGVTLQVTVCGGLMDLTSWSATVSGELKGDKQVKYDGAVYDFTIDQSSTGAATLNRVSITASGDGAEWTGSVTGTAHINHKVVQSVGSDVIGTTTEKGDPALNPLANVHLTATWTRADGCRFAVSYED